MVQEKKVTIYTFDNCPKNLDVIENKNKQTYIQTDRHPTALYKGIAGKHPIKFELNWLGHLGGTVKQKHSLHIVYNQILEKPFF